MKNGCLPRTCPLGCATTHRTDPITDGGSLGSHKRGLADLFEALSHPSWETRRLLDMAAEWLACRNEQANVGHDFQRQFQPKQSEALAVRIGDKGVKILIERFRAGETKQRLADQYNCSLSTIERLLRLRGVRRRRRT